MFPVRARRNVREVSCKLRDWRRPSFRLGASYSLRRSADTTLGSARSCHDCVEESLLLVESPPRPRAQSTSKNCLQ